MGILWMQMEVRTEEYSSFPLRSEGHLSWKESKCQGEGVAIFLAEPLEIHLLLWPPTSVTPTH